MSYSEVIEILRESKPEEIEQLLSNLNKDYESLIDTQAELEQKINQLKEERGLIVDTFLNIHRARKLGDLPLVFIEEEHNEYQKVVIVKVLSESERKIDHQSFNVTKWNNHRIL